jgi:hypothetical protein
MSVIRGGWLYLGAIAALTIRIGFIVAVIGLIVAIVGLLTGWTIVGLEVTAIGILIMLIGLLIAFGTVVVSALAFLWDLLLNFLSNWWQRGWTAAKKGLVGDANRAWFLLRQGTSNFRAVLEEGASSALSWIKKKLGLSK